MEKLNLSPQNKLYGLDHLRALVIITILFFHYIRFYGHPAWFPKVLNFGWTGVDLFFVLCSFLIASQLFAQMKKQIKSSHYLILFLCSFMLLFESNGQNLRVTKENQSDKEAKSRQQITAMLDSFNIAAAKADFKTYFNFYTEDAIFIGTDASERWDKKAFMDYAKPHFDKGKAWNFTSLERHIYFDKKGSFAWFDELLKTQMKICRGSGVIVKQGNNWKVQQYVLSASIPNDIMNAVVKMKTPIEDSMIKKYLKKSLSRDGIWNKDTLTLK